MDLKKRLAKRLLKGKDHCTSGFQFDRFVVGKSAGIYYIAKLLNQNQSNGKLAVQSFFPIIGVILCYNN